MLLCTVQGDEAGHVKEWDEYGGRHAVATGYARHVTEAEAKQHKTAAKALARARKKAVPHEKATARRKSETPESPKKG